MGQEGEERGQENIRKGESLNAKGTKWGRKVNE
jgi:hypothetical protein